MAFKPDIDDLRESPALEIARKLGKQGLNILAIEPHINSLPNDLPENIKLIELDKNHMADIHVILVKHTQFKNLDLKMEKTLNFCGL